MNRNIIIICFFLCLVLITYGIAQTVDAYNTEDKAEYKGLLDPSRFSINNMVSFGMASSNFSSGLKSQGMYTTMLAYKLSNPLTLNLNFTLPIFSSFNSAQNLSAQNIQSLDYFKNMPLDATLTWQPRDNFMMQLSISKNEYGYPYSYSPFYSSYDRVNMYHHFGMGK